MNHEKIVILDMGSPNCQIAAYKVREQQVYSEVKPSPLSSEDAGQYKGMIVIPGAHGNTVPDAGIPIFAGDVLTADPAALRSFLYDICGCKGDWSLANFTDDAIAAVREKVGDRKVLCALSGGVDSSVCARIVQQAVGKQLTCIFVDHGLMRKHEPAQIEETFSQYDMNFIHINAEERFLNRLSGVSDPEQKRKIIGEEFIRVFEEESKKIGQVDFLVQGTIYPDIIESGWNGAALVKSHHNVGGLPDHVDFKEILEPVRDLFKAEVRAVGAYLGLPDFLVTRQPFPGPGLGVRCIGALTKERLDSLRDADHIFREEITNSGLQKALNQFFAILTPIQSTGVADGKRTFEYTVALRAITTGDFMTARAAEIPYSTLQTVSARIVNEVAGVNRVVYDITNKPPATIEWE